MRDFVPERFPRLEYSASYSQLSRNPSICSLTKSTLPKVRI